MTPTEALAPPSEVENWPDSPAKEIQVPTKAKQAKIVTPMRYWMMRHAGVPEAASPLWPILPTP